MNGSRAASLTVAWRLASLRVEGFPWIPAVILGAIALVAVFANVLAPYNPEVGVLGDRELRLAPTSANGRSDWQALWDHLTVESIMTHSTLTISAQTHVRDAIRVLCDSHVDSLPVVQEGEIVGVVTIAELLSLLSNLLE